MEGGKGGARGFRSGGQWPGAGEGGHCGDLRLRGCAVGMCRRRLRSWQIPIIIIIIIIIINYTYCDRNHDDGPVASLAWLLLITCRAVSAVGGSGLWQARLGATSSRLRVRVHRCFWGSLGGLWEGAHGQAQLSATVAVSKEASWPRPATAGPGLGASCYRPLLLTKLGCCKLPAIMMLPALVKRYD